MIEENPALIAELEEKIRALSDTAEMAETEFELDEDSDDEFDISLMGDDE